MDQMKLLVSIVERGHGVAMQRLYGKYQLFLHLQCAGRGTATSEIMDILGLGSTEKDVVLSFASQAPPPPCSTTWTTTCGAGWTPRASYSPCL